MTQSKTLAIFLMLIGVISYSAQGVDDRAKNRAENKANNRVDTRIDQGLDKGLDAIEGLFKKKKKSTDDTTDSSKEAAESNESEAAEKNNVDAEKQAGNSSSMFGAMFQPAEWEDTYVFDFRSVAQITTTDKKGKVENADWEWMLSDDAFGMVVKDPKGKEADVRIVFDLVNHSFITLTEDKGEKQGIAISMNQDQIAAAVDQGVEEGTESYGAFEKTGKTKQILGYKCDEYTFSNVEDNTEGNMWMTTELKADMTRVLGMMSNGGKNKSDLPANYPQGFALEMQSRDTKKNTSHHYLVTEVDTNANVQVDLSPYNVMDPMGMMNQGK